MARRPRKLDTHLERIKEDAARPGASKEGLARQFGVARDTMRKFLDENKIEVTGALIAPDPARPVDPAEVLQQENAELKRRLQRGRQSDVRFERVLSELRSGVHAADVRFEAPSAPKTIQAQHTQALLFSDLHGGEVVKKEEIGGLNEYNWEIAVARTQQIAKSLLSFQHARPYPIEHLELWILGDMNSGDKHDELAQTNEFPVAEQAIKVGKLIGGFAEGLVPHYRTIKLVCVDGNHGRVPRKPASKQVFNNWDWVSYETAQIKLEKYESVEVVIPRSGQHVHQIAGRTVLLFHGDGIRSTMPGVPWGGITRRTNELSKQYAEMGIQIDHFALGHFHQSNVVQGGKIFVNGAVKGVDDWSLKQFGGGERPTQLLLTFDERKSRLTDVSFITP